MKDPLTGIEDLDDYRRAPWMYDRFPYRCLIARIKNEELGQPPFSEFTWWRQKPQIWMVMPMHYSPETWLVPGTGKRQLLLPWGTMLTHTWESAMEYAHHGTVPALLEHVYPEWCGL